MKKKFAVFTMLMFMIVSVGPVFAAPPPISVTHTLAGSSQGGTSKNLTFTLHVVNRGIAPIKNLTLTSVPLPPLMSGVTTQNIGTLNPRQGTDIPLLITVPSSFNTGEVLQSPLIFTIKYVDAQGNSVESPVTSHLRGVR